MGSSVAVVICSWSGDDRPLTIRTVRAAVSQSGPGGTVLVDMSPDRGLIEAVAEIDGLIVHHARDSRGLGQSRQLGLEHVERRYVAFLDSDAVPRSGWLEALADAVEPEDVAVAGGPVLPVWPEGARVPRLFRTQPAGDFLSMLDLGGARIDVPRVLPGNMIIDREAVNDLGFDRALGRRGSNLLGAEEIGMLLEIRRRGGRIVYEPRAAVDHHTRRDRLRWRWMWRRVEAAGREAALTAARLEPLPRTTTVGDRAFIAAVALPYIVGKLGARRAAV